MAGAIGFALILLAIAALVALHGTQSIAGLEPDAFAALVSIAAFALMIMGSVFHEFRGRWLQGLRAIATWALVLVALVAGYTYRFDLKEFGNRLIGELSPGQTVETPAGEVSVARRLDGTFVVNGRAGDKSLRFIFDTGASTVVLTAESAKAIGLDQAGLSYTVPVWTANGQTLAALTTLDQLTVGSITERRVRTLVARPGVLRENLLGMTFLERLASYEVRNNRLILRGRGA